MPEKSQKQFRKELVEKKLAKTAVRKDLTILERWGITPEYLTKVVDENPSLRGMIIGYIAERKLREIFEQDKRVTASRKDDDHDREKKGDLVVTYKGEEFKFEVKSLQTNSIRFVNTLGVAIPMIQRVRDGSTKDSKPKYRYVRNPDFDNIDHKARMNGRYIGTFQCDASDRRPVQLPGEQLIETTCLRVGEFDILAAGLFGFREKWDFGFALNRELPTTNSNKYPASVQNCLLATSMKIQWPLEGTFVSDPFILMDQIVSERRRKKF